MLDRFAALVFAGRVAADDTGLAIAQNGGLGLAASMAWEPRARPGVSIHIALVVWVDIRAAAMGSLFVVMLEVRAAVPVDTSALVRIDTHAVVRVEVSAARIDSAAAIQAGLTFAPDGLVASGWALDGGEAAQCSDCDPERDSAQLPRPALR